MKCQKEKDKHPMILPISVIEKSKKKKKQTQIQIPDGWLPEGKALGAGSKE